MDWEGSVRVLLGAAHESPGDGELGRLAQTLAQPGALPNPPDANQEQFFSTLALLASHHLPNSLSGVSPEQLPNYVKASRNLLRYAHHRLQSLPEQRGAKQGPLPSLAAWAKALECLEKASGLASRSEVLSLTAQLKSSVLPAHLRGSSQPPTDGADSAEPTSVLIYRPLLLHSPEASGLPSQGEFQRQVQQQMKEEGIGEALAEAIESLCLLKSRKELDPERSLVELSGLAGALKLNLWGQTPEALEARVVKAVSAVVSQVASSVFKATPSLPTLTSVHIINLLVHGVSRVARERLSGAPRQELERAERSLVRAWLSEALQTLSQDTASQSGAPPGVPVWMADAAEDFASEPEPLLLLLQTLGALAGPAAAFPRPVSQPQLEDTPTPTWADDSTILGSWLEDLLSSVPQLSDQPQQGPGQLSPSLSQDPSYPASSRRLRELIRSLLRALIAKYVSGPSQRRAPSGSSEWTMEAVGVLGKAWEDLARLEGLEEELRELAEGLGSGGVLSAETEDSLVGALVPGPAEDDLQLQLPTSVLAFLLHLNLARSAGSQHQLALALWHRLIATLLRHSLYPAKSTGDKTGPPQHLSPQQAQTFAFLFHSLPLQLRLQVTTKLVSALEDLDAAASPPLAQLLILTEYLCEEVTQGPSSTLLNQLRRNVIHPDKLNTPNFLHVPQLEEFLCAQSEVSEEDPVLFLLRPWDEEWVAAEGEKVQSDEAAALKRRAAAAVERLVRGLEPAEESALCRAAEWTAFLLARRLLASEETPSTALTTKAVAGLSSLQLVGLAEGMGRMEEGAELETLLVGLAEAERALLEAEGGEWAGWLRLALLHPHLLLYQPSPPTLLFPSPARQAADRELNLRLGLEEELGEVGEGRSEWVLERWLGEDWREEWGGEDGSTAQGASQARRRRLLQLLLHVGLSRLAALPKETSETSEAENADGRRERLCSAALQCGAGPAAAKALVGEPAAELRLRSEWLAQAFLLLTDQGPKHGPSQTALVGAIAASLPEDAEGSWVKAWAQLDVQGSGQRLYRLWRGDESKESGVGSSEMRYLAECVFRAAAEREELVPLATQLGALLKADLVSDWASHDGGLWRLAKALLAFLSARKVPWRDEVVRLTLDWVPWKPVPAKGATLVRSERWGMAELKTASKLSSFHSWLSLAVSFALLDGGTELRGILRRCSLWLRHSKDLLCQENCLDLVKGLDVAAEEVGLVTAQSWDTAASVIGFVGEIMAAVRQDQDLGEEEDKEGSSGESEDDGTGEDGLSSGEVTASGAEAMPGLCTFTRTGKDFETQHWYHCHSCGMVAGEGVCSVCARLCHASHDLSYAKFGSFFCDCGAKGEGSCQSLRRRSPLSLATPLSLPPPSSTPLHSSPSSKLKPRPALLRSFHLSSRLISDAAKKVLRDELTGGSGAEVCETLLGLLSYMSPAVSRGAELMSGSGAVERRRKALDTLFPLPSPSTERHILKAWSQKPSGLALEKVSTASFGDPLRQLVNNHSVRRQPICFLSPSFVVLAQDKNRVSVLPVGSLLQQLSVANGKVSLQRSGYETMKMDVVSLSALGGPVGGSVVACGLRQVALLDVSAQGTIASTVYLPVTLQSSNHIIGAKWIRHGRLLLITADFVNVYHLDEESEAEPLKEQPKRHFLIPLGKVADAAVVSTLSEDGAVAESLVVGSSTGSVFLQPLGPETEFKDSGPFYLTEALDLGAAEGVAVSSLHFSAPLGLLLVGYADGKAATAPVGGLARSPAPDKAALWAVADEAVLAWQELPSTPGLFAASTRQGAQPILLYLRPQTSQLEKLSVPALSGGLLCTQLLQSSPESAALLALSEDGEVFLFAEPADRPLDFWRMPPPAHLPVQTIDSAKAPPPPPQPTLHVNFFESCLPLNQLSFKGNDLLQIYSRTELKSRLLINSQPIGSPKAGGWELEIENEDPEVVICGIRVEVGKSALERAPKTISVFGRQKTVAVSRQRWVDVPFTRAETAESQGRVKVRFSGSDSEPLMIDGLRVYGKSKDAFGWEAEVGGQRSTAKRGSSEREAPLPHLLLTQAFHTLRLYFRTLGNGRDRPSSASDLATAALVSGLQPACQVAPRALLAQLIPDAEARALHSDTFLLSFLWRSVERAATARDPELLAYLLPLLRDVTVERPLNLHHALTASHVPLSVDSSPSKDVVASGKARRPLIPALVELFWDLLGLWRGPAELLSVGQTPLREEKTLCWLLVEVLLSYARVQPSFVGEAAQALFRLLTCPQPGIAQTARLALQATLKPPSASSQHSPAVVLPIEQASRNSSVPSQLQAGPAVVGPPQHALLNVQDSIPFAEEELGEEEEGLAEVVVVEEELDMEDGEEVDDADELEELIEAAAGGEDENAMLQLAVALSLQPSAPQNPAPPAPVDHGISQDDDLVPPPPAEALPSGSSGANVTQEPESALLSDTSGPVSEDEASSSHQNPPQPEDSTTQAEDVEEKEGLQSLELLSTALLEELSLQLPRLRAEGIAGQDSVAFLQVLLVLLSREPRENGEGLSRVLSRVVESAGLERGWSGSRRSREGEQGLLLLRLLSVVLSWAKASRGTPRQAQEERLATTAARLLLAAGSLPFFKSVLSQLHQDWLANPSAMDSANPMMPTAETAVANPAALPDLSPFFQPQYIADCGKDLFKRYPQLLIEILLRLPYQMKKVLDRSEARPDGRGQASVLDEEWKEILCQLVSCQEVVFVRRYARKLLLLIAGSKEDYRQLRDSHQLGRGLDTLRGLALSPAAHSFHCRSQMLEQLKAMGEVAKGRPRNWQAFLRQEGKLRFLLDTASGDDDAIGASALALIAVALAPTGPFAPTASSSAKPSSKPSLSKLKAEAKTRRKSSETEEGRGTESSDDGGPLAECLMREDWRESLVKLLKRGLLQSKVMELRRGGQGLVRGLMGRLSRDKAQKLLNVLWTELWPQAQLVGSRAEVVGDLLGFFSLELWSPKELAAGARPLLQAFCDQLLRLRQHPNSLLYESLGRYLPLDGHFLESEPCPVCDDPDVPFQQLKLSSVKAESRWSTDSQMVKLNGSLEIQRVTVRLSEVKRGKMVAKLRLLVSEEELGSAVEVKRRVGEMEEVKEVAVAAGQTEIRLDLGVGVVARALVLHFSAFHKPPAPASEMLHCPRCSATVPPNPGICSNCGENVFQCHKCRTINYDEKDPFLCNSCGFSKYGKMEVTLVGRPATSVQSVGSPEQRAKAQAAIPVALNSAHNYASQICVARAQIESSLLSAAATQQPSASSGTSSGGHGPSPSSMPEESRLVSAPLRHSVQQLSLKYSLDCRKSFAGLRRALHEVAALRREILAFDARCGIPVPPSVGLEERRSSGTPCYGCLQGHLLLCARLLTSLLSGCDGRVWETHTLTELLRLQDQTPDSVRPLLAELTAQLCRGDDDATRLVCDDLQTRLSRKLRAAQTQLPVETELELLRSSLLLSDELWQPRLKALLRVLVLSVNSPHPQARSHLAHPCLRILQNFLHTPSETGTSSAVPDNLLQQWLTGLPAQGSEAREAGLERKFGERWLRRCGKAEREKRLGWLGQLLLCEEWQSLRGESSSLLREAASESSARRAGVLAMCASELKRAGRAGESGTELVELLESLSEEPEWRAFLAARGLVQSLLRLLESEVAGLMASEVAGGVGGGGAGLPVVVRQLRRLLTVDGVRRRWKRDVVGPVLEAYLWLRQVVLTRSWGVESAQDGLLELLEELTSGTDEERRNLAVSCLNALHRYPIHDTRTPLFLFERVCDIIRPSSAATAQFSMKIDKDPAQEDFLQGRMLGNPYASTAPGLGPLMKDVKNKICRDCELVALLEDDNGMELLVDGKIVSLELPVAEVYEKLWLPRHPDQPLMGIMYRMRGLLGDATEEFIESLETKAAGPEDEEKEFRRAEVVGESGGLPLIFQRLHSLNSSAEHFRNSSDLLHVILKLLHSCLKLKSNRLLCLSAALGAVPTLLGSFRLSLDADPESAADILQLTLLILREGDAQEEAAARAFLDSIRVEQGTMEWLLGLLDSEETKEPVRESVSRLLGLVGLSSAEASDWLVRHFQPVLRLVEYDSAPTAEQTRGLENLCLLAGGIPASPSGARLKAAFNARIGVVEKLMEYIQLLCPPLFKVGLSLESPEWKEYLGRKGLKFALRILQGFCVGDAASQELVVGRAEFIMTVHRLEQLSTEERLGTLAEALMESLADSDQLRPKIDAIRKETKRRRKEMAMAVRQIHLKEVGMEAEGTRLKPKRRVAESESISEEAGLVCSVCREGYQSQPTKLLAAYTFSTRVMTEPAQLPSPSLSPAFTYSTVSHFNLIHLDCHLSAVRSARGREEWESAALHNANTRANGLLPLWGPAVPETNFASALARHNTYLQDATQVPDISFHSGVHDAKLLLLRFAEEKSFSSESGGGGAESNVQLLPCLLLLPLYVLNQTRGGPSQLAALKTFLGGAKSGWVGSSFAVDGPLYHLVASLLLLSPTEWEAERERFLERALVAGQARAVFGPRQPPKAVLPSAEPAEWATLRAPLRLFALVDGVQTEVWRDAAAEAGEAWPQTLQRHLRAKEAEVREAAKGLLRRFAADVLPAQSFAQLAATTSLVSLRDAAAADAFLANTLASLTAS